ncbi:hypothetical protein SORBI_3008G159200 [Sorghum bicolor]|uniref:Uncharacterized protein n=1 Tax=Sorghum bicolor TaxID=4558 RepID=A0A1B6PDZ6_SORBI|nr:hypothetical protein SORBI_3008G159200 [Sorghum bicolor]
MTTRPRLQSLWPHRPDSPWPGSSRMLAGVAARRARSCPAPVPALHGPRHVRVGSSQTPCPGTINSGATSSVLHQSLRWRSTPWTTRSFNSASVFLVHSLYRTAC